MLSMRKIVVVVSVLLGSTSVLNAAFDAEVGKKLAVTCMGCHGQAGVSMNPVWPNLAGQKRDYLVKQLQAFRTGERKDPLMNPMAGTLTTANIEALAEYFSTLPR